jgi:cell wall-associated NlpC family hydrolase
MSKLDWLVFYAFSFIGVHYHYGGSSPMSGLDCSGFALLPLKAAGFVSYNVDLSAQDLYDLLKSPGLGSPLITPQGGALSFYGTPKNIHHVGFVVNETMMLEAAGGDETTISKEEALLRGAFVKLMPIHYRKDFLTVIMPNY